MKPTLRLTHAIVLVLLAIGCGSESSPGEITADATETDTTTDIDSGLTCTGIGFDPNASSFNEQCVGVTECTDMDPPEGQASGCYCSICGPKGGTVQCIQATCVTPGG